MPDITSTIATEAASPASSTADGQSASARPLGELMRVQNFLDQRAAMKKRRRGMVFTSLVTPGPICDNGQQYGAAAPGPFGGGV